MDFTWYHKFTHWLLPLKIVLPSVTTCICSFKSLKSLLVSLLQNIKGRRVLLVPHPVHHTHVLLWVAEVSGQVGETQRLVLTCVNPCCVLCSDRDPVKEDSEGLPHSLLTNWPKTEQSSGENERSSAPLPIDRDPHKVQVYIPNGTLFPILCTTFDHSPIGPGQEK